MRFLAIAFLGYKFSLHYALNLNKSKIFNANEVKFHKLPKFYKPKLKTVAVFQYTLSDDCTDLLLCRFTIHSYYFRQSKQTFFLYVAPMKK